VKLSVSASSPAVSVKTFDDWIDLFRDWQRKIDLEVPGLKSYTWEAKYGDLRSSEIEFGDYAGQPKWERVSQIPHQPVKDALLNLVVYQGDTEFASVEQQRNLFRTAPSAYDLETMTRIMAEEMRHGWQMCHLLVTHFGEAGKIEARKLLERRSWQHNRLLGSFNEDVSHWVDFYVYTDFVDRDGKYQLNMLSTSSFAPLARSMGPMLKEEAFHIGTGQTGLGRILRGRRVPAPLLQKYLNKWIPTAYDLFGVDQARQLGVVLVGAEADAALGRVEGPQRGRKARAARRGEVHRNAAVAQLAQQRHGLGRVVDAEGTEGVRAAVGAERSGLGVEEHGALSAAS